MHKKVNGWIALRGRVKAVVAHPFGSWTSKFKALVSYNIENLSQKTKQNKKEERKKKHLLSIKTE